MKTSRVLTLFLTLAFFLTPVLAHAQEAENPNRLSVMFLGDDGHHNPGERAQQILPAFQRRGIDVFYTDEVEDINLDHLQQYDAVIFYANYMEMTEPQEQALVEYVEGGGGFVPLHSASGMFRNSEAYIDLVGGAFESHGTGVFSTTRVEPDHPAVRGVPTFESWDETYVHQKLNPDKTVLAVREDGEREEPYTWVRTQGQGRVFYTAWGHDERTWSTPGFQDLVAQGVRWAAGDEALSAEPAPDAFEYVEAALPSLEYNSTIANERTPRSMQLPLGAEQSMEHMIVPPGFEVKLFAAEPDIANPLYMAWDERGRLWVAETEDYPNDLKEAEGAGSDRIKILEDTDGDGRADKFTVFADSLSIPTSFAFANGGIVVTAAPRTLFFKDTDGDDRADVRKTLFSGWGTFDTHAGPNNIRMGPDNWIWGVVGYSGFDGEVGGEPHKFPMAIYRFKPDGSKLEHIRTTNNNTWGFGFSEEGIAFASTANNNPSVYMPLAQRYYEGVRGWSADALGTIAPDPSVHPITAKTRQGDWKGSYTAGSGHALYTARQFPKEYWNRISFVGGPTVHTLGRFALEPEGADFVAKNKWNMLASDDEWTLPIAAEVGPDGAVWMIDWYDYIPQHNLGPFAEGWESGENNAYVTDLRDQKHGRIYRIVHTDSSEDAASYEPLDLSEAAPDELVETLQHSNMFWRLTAQRLLIERDAQEALPALYGLVQDTSTDALGLNPGALHALWTLHGLGALDGSDEEALQVATEALQHPSASVRRAALKVLPPTAASLQAALDAGVLNDEDAQVRLAALLALADMPASEEAGTAVFSMLTEPENAEDRWIPDAATAAGAQHAAGFLAAATDASRNDPFAEGVQKAVGRVSFHRMSGILSGAESTPATASGADAAAADSSRRSEEPPSSRSGSRPNREGVITISAVGNDLKYDLEAIQAEAGSELTIRFVNEATSPMMTHNVVVVEDRAAIDPVGRAAMTAQENDYIPPAHADKILAHTPLAAPQETVEVTFTVPPPGEYPYICTFPGHYIAMQGTLTSVDPSASASRSR